VAQTFVVAIDAAPRVVTTVLDGVDPAPEARRALAALGLEGVRWAFDVRPREDDGTWLTVTTRGAPRDDDAVWLVAPVLAAVARRLARTIASRAEQD
jgi:hypothetical protein